MSNLVPPRRGNYYSFSNYAIIIPIWLTSRDVQVFQVRIRDPEGILVPVVTEGFQVPVVVMLAVDFQMYDHPFLFSIYIRHRSAMLL